MIFKYDYDYYVSYALLIIMSDFFQDNYTALHIAVEGGKALVVETLLGYGAHVHIKGKNISCV